MLSNNDKDLIRKAMKEPGWDLIKKEMLGQASTYRDIAEQPDMEEHYRLILFSKAQGIEEFYRLSQDLIK
ncbi:hypothetical protein LCGC14_3139300 [marine sediment metagenome]|uniref:Uncharacterized protein n=1 Tax=marine sediment metagenome TaxID=412755 RepID=A0A0F8VXG8_9ZZZZ|nr:hypothetical protein [Candidatus Scalindua sp.]